MYKIIRYRHTYSQGILCGSFKLVPYFPLFFPSQVLTLIRFLRSFILLTISDEIHDFFALLSTFPTESPIVCYKIFLQFSTAFPQFNFTFVCKEIFFQGIFYFLSCPSPTSILVFLFETLKFPLAQCRFLQSIKLEHREYLPQAVPAILYAVLN